MSVVRHARNLALALILGAAPAASAKPAPDSFSELAERLSPAVVNISTSQKIEREDLDQMPQFPPGSPYEEMFKDYYDQQQKEGSSQVTSLGSGFVIDAGGIIVTNNHVIEGADEVTVNFPDGRSLPAEIVGKDDKTDLAVLRVKASGPLPYVNFGDSGALKVGDWVMAIGNPFGLGGTVTAGIVSARNRVIDSGPYDDFIQTDAAINRGNSGGPLFDMDGNVIGVNSAIISPSGGSIGIGFAIPSSIVKRTVDQLVQFGETRRGWIGVRIQTVTPELAESLGLDRARGALVAETTPGGPAAAAGIQPQDVILSFDGREVKDSRSLPRVVAESEIGKAVPIEVWRDRRSMALTITLGRLEDFERSATDGGSTGGESPQTPDKPAEQQGSVHIDALGMTVAEMSDSLRERFKIGTDVQGVVITEIAQDSPAGAAAAENRIRVGDVILEVAQQEVSTPQAVADKVGEAIKADGRVVLFLLNRGGDLSFAAIRLGN
ncbi:MAG: DegQ family serine endoprotease [Alphaproteobacteria bacterium]|nr:DegQ family serine endoprotease [Alphaproteobacteria bacterium]